MKDIKIDNYSGDISALINAAPNPNGTEVEKFAYEIDRFYQDSDEVNDIIVSGRSAGLHREYETPLLPQADNIVRAWSLRRCVPAYLRWNSIRADRPSDPVGAPGLLGAFNKVGLIDFPAGADANAYELYDQMGEANAALVVAGGNLANAPLVYSSGAMLKGLRLQDTSDLMAMAEIDAALSAALNDNLTGYTLSIWVKINSSSEALSTVLYRLTPEAGFLRVLYETTSNTISVRAREASGRVVGNAVAGWNHVVLTLKGADGTANGYKAYLNVSTTFSRAVPSIPAALGTSPIRIGGTATGSNTDVNDIIIWNRELSATDVANLFEAQRVHYGVLAK